MGLCATLVLFTGCDTSINIHQRGYQYREELQSQGEDVRCEVPDRDGEYRIKSGQVWCRFPGARPLGTLP